MWCFIIIIHYPTFFVGLNNTYPNYWFLYHTLLMVSIIIHYPNLWVQSLLETSAARVDFRRTTPWHALRRTSPRVHGVHGGRTDLGSACKVAASHGDATGDGHRFLPPAVMTGGWFTIVLPTVVSKLLMVGI